MSLIREIKPLEEERLGWMAATFESVLDLVFIADLKDRFIYANPAALKKLGYTREELIGKTGKLMMSERNPKNLREEVLQKTLEPPYIWEGEVINVTKEGHEYCAYLKTALVRNKRGEPIGMTGISRDITEQKKEQEELESYAKKLEKANQELRKTQEQLLRTEKLAAVGVLSAGLAHEIGNPLASISSLVQLLQRKKPDEKIAESLENIQGHVQRISWIIQNVRDFTKEDQQSFMAVDLEEILRNSLQRICLQRNEKRIEIQTKFEPHLPRVSAEASQLSQAFNNIFINAFEAMGEEGKLEIFAQCFVKDMVQISIKDSGRGIPKENMRKIFEPFFTTKEVGKGQGLGLSVSSGIIKSFGGDIRVESIVGEGSKFEILLKKYL